MSTAVSVEGLSKRYDLGEIGTRTLSRDLNRWWARVRGKPDPEGKIGEQDLRSDNQRVWALRDVNLSVEEGQILGVIGRNGAGKSTLLKILSRITAPTSGCVRIRGQIASLLEVGTGFHPELTGRENAYLNGAILGMSRAEVRRKLDDIVDFSGVGKFIDTPIKRYSSGMHVRLAFAVAAHLEPEILLVDEVLAVGDASFQRRCLGKMNEVARSGRTILFVSHNMPAVRQICEEATLLEDGAVVYRGEASDVVERYLASSVAPELLHQWPVDSRPGNRFARFVSLRVCGGDSEGESLSTARPLTVRIEVEIEELRDNLCVGFDLLTSEGSTVFRSFHTDSLPLQPLQLRSGVNILECQIPAGFLARGPYLLAPRAGLHAEAWIVRDEPVLLFELELGHGESPFWCPATRVSRPGAVSPILHWTRSEAES